MTVAAPVKQPREVTATPPTRRWLEHGLVIALAGMIVVASATVPRFASAANARSVLTDASFVGMVAVGMTFVVVSGSFIDLSVVAQIPAAAITLAVLQPHVGLGLAVLGAIAAAQVFAAANALGVGLVGGNPVVVTLAVQAAGLGVLSYLTSGSQYKNQSQWLYDTSTSSIGPIPAPFLMLVFVAAVGQLVLARTNAGLAVRATGTSRSGAQIAGARPVRATWTAFAISSATCAVTAILLTGFNNSAISGMGTSYDFSSLAAVIIGGTSLFGGSGSVLKTLLGVSFVAALLNILVLVGLPYNYQQLIQGLIIVVTVAADAALRRGGAR